MPKVSPIQSSFSTGEVTPLFSGRVDADRYKAALETCLNYVPTAQGGLTRRPGTYYVSEVKTSSARTRLVRFEYSTTQAYILEFGDLYIRFYKDRGQVLNAGSPYEVVSPYTTAQLFDLKFTQSADVLYVAHPSIAPRKITRTSHTAWTVTELAYNDGPYLPVNATTTTLAPSATTGAGITISASASVFVSTDVGRFVRIKHGSTWGFAIITAYSNATTVTATVSKTFGNTTSVVDWRLGLWSTTTGFPSVVVFHEDRLFFAGVTNYPQRLDGSCSGDYENFAPSATDSVVADNNAVSYSLNSNDVNSVRWMTSDEKGLLAGTPAGEWSVKPSSQSEAITPTNISAKQTTAYGSSTVQPVQVGRSTMFVQRAGKKLREMTYFYDVDGFRAPDLTLISEHITGTGITQLAYQKEPYPIVWCVRSDGVLCAMTYERDSDSLKVGWHRHILGGVSDAAGSDAIVESAAVIPSTDGTTEDLWLIVKRYINGGTKRYVEYVTPYFSSDADTQDAFFSDCGLTYDSPKTITGATKASPCVITAASHGFSNGDVVQILEVAGMTELNGNTYTIANVAANTFELSGTDSSAYTTYVSGGEARKLVSTVSGLTHLEGQTVSILADGAVQPSQTVASGAVSLTTTPAAVVQVGLPITARAKLLRIDAGSADGTSLGKTRRMHRAGFLLYRTLGFKFGMSFDALDEVTFRRSVDSMTRAVPLFSGVVSQELEADYDTENQICFEQTQPLPGTVLAVMPQMVTQDRG